MSRETCKTLLLVCAAVTLVRPVIVAQDAARNSNTPTQTRTTELQILVTGGEEATPVRGATVYIEWTENGETKRKEGATNRKGIAGPYRVPLVNVFIQVTTEGGEWERKGGDFDLKTLRGPITINLPKKSPQQERQPG